MDVVPVLRTIRSVAPHNVEDGQRIEITRMQQLARRALLGLGEDPREDVDGQRDWWAD